MPAEKPDRSVKSLFGTGSLAAATAESVAEILLADIRPNPFQPRKDFPQDELKELAASIRQHGLLQAIIVREIPPTPEGVRYELIAGERRWKAHQILELPKIKAIVREADDSRMRVYALVENFHRANLSVVDGAAGFVACQKELGQTKAVDTAKALGISESMGYLYQRIGRADPEALEIIRRDRLDFRESDFLLNLMGRIKKLKADARWGSAGDIFKQLQKGPVTRELMAEIHAEHFTQGEGGSENDQGKLPPKSRAGTAQKRKGFWQNDREFHLTLEAPRGGEVGSKDTEFFVRAAERFFQKVGAKKVDIRF